MPLNKFRYLIMLLGILMLIGGESRTSFATVSGFCDGHKDGHMAGVQSFGRGYSGYPGCPGDPGSVGGNSSGYQRGFVAGMRKATRDMCRQFPAHQNCR